MGTFESIYAPHSITTAQLIRHKRRWLGRVAQESPNEPLKYLVANKNMFETALHVFVLLGYTRLCIRRRSIVAIG